jgi:fructokinase
LNPDTAALHFGSLASWTPPGCAHILRAVAARRADARTLISYDPNVRPSLLGAPERARIMVEESVRLAHIVKASRDDLDWLYPGQAVERVAARWLELGAMLAVITDGAEGARAYPAAGEIIYQPGRQTQVVDTVGAGDAFTAGLLSALARRDLLRPPAVSALATETLADTLDEANLVASLTCERVGADPPSLAQRPDWRPDEKLTLADLRYGA